MAALRCDESTSGETNPASFRRRRRNEFRQNKLSLKSTLPAGWHGESNPACLTAKVLFWNGHYGGIHERRVAGFGLFIALLGIYTSIPVEFVWFSWSNRCETIYLYRFTMVEHTNTRASENNVHAYRCYRFAVIRRMPHSQRHVAVAKSTVRQRRKVVFCVFNSTENISLSRHCTLPRQDQNVTASYRDFN